MDLLKSYGGDSSSSDSEEELPTVPLSSTHDKTLSLSIPSVNLTPNVIEQRKVQKMAVVDPTTNEMYYNPRFQELLMPEVKQQQHDFFGLGLRAISDEQANQLIYEKELAPFGANPLIAHDAVSQLVDVSVDTALGPNVRENLLKNLSGKQMAQLPLGPLPKMKKSDSDKLAKRKHQITHLAAVAVSREEQLQEKWADSKQTKRMSRQKYGF